MSFALIDMGSNTIRLSVYACGLEAEQIRSASASAPADDLGSFVRLFSKKVTAGLASYVDKGNKLTEEGITRACESLSYLKTIADNLRIDDIHVFATASLRNVSNSNEAKAAIERRCGLPVEIVSAKEEALLGYSSFRHDCPLERGVMMDVGGGSAEIVAFAHGAALYVSSMPIGSLKLYRKYVSGILPTKREHASLCARIDKELAHVDLGGVAKSDVLVGIGGTARAAAKLMRAAGNMDALSECFEFEQLEELADLLISGKRRASRLVLQVCPDRIHTIAPGVLVLVRAGHLLGCKSLRVSRYGVREGYVCSRIIV